MFLLQIFASIVIVFGIVEPSIGKCLSVNESIVDDICLNYLSTDDQIFFTDGPQFAILGFIGFNIRKATHKAHFIPSPECKEALMPFICASGFNRCHKIDESLTINRDPCRSMCEDVLDACSDIFDLDPSSAPNCTSINNQTGLDNFPIHGNNKSIIDPSNGQRVNRFVPCFALNNHKPVPDFPFDCPWPFKTSKDGCVFMCPAPVTDDKDRNERFQEFYLWSRRFVHVPIYIMGVAFLVMLIIARKSWFHPSKLLVSFLHILLLFTNIWNLVGLESNLDPVCHSDHEPADIDDVDCRFQAFFISGFAGIGFTWFCIMGKALYESRFGAPKLSKWVVYLIVAIGTLLQLIPPIIILATESYAALAVTCSVDYFADLGEFKHFYFWSINGPESFFVFTGFILLIVFVVRTAQVFLKNAPSTKQKRNHLRMLFFCFTFGCVIVASQVTTLDAVNSEKYGKSAEKWAVCIINKFIDELFPSDALTDPTKIQCSWKESPDVESIEYGVISGAIFDLVLMAWFFDKVYDSIKNPHGSSTSSHRSGSSRSTNSNNSNR